MKEQDESLFYLLKRAAEHAPEVRRERDLRSRAEAEMLPSTAMQALLSDGMARGF